MPKFRISASVTGSKYIGEFEAENEEKAKQMASESDEGWVNLCHQCASECEDPECQDFHAEKISE